MRKELHWHSLPMVLSGCCSDAAIEQVCAGMWGKAAFFGLIGLALFFWGADILERWANA